MQPIPASPYRQTASFPTNYSPIQMLPPQITSGRQPYIAHPVPINPSIHIPQQTIVQSSPSRILSPPVPTQVQQLFHLPQPQISTIPINRQGPPLERTETKLNYVPQKRQVTTMVDQEIQETIPKERTIIEYIPVQTVIEKVPQPIEVPYEVKVPVPVQVPYYIYANGEKQLADQNQAYQLSQYYGQPQYQQNEGYNIANMQYPMQRTDLQQTINVQPKLHPMLNNEYGQQYGQQYGLPQGQQYGWQQGWPQGQQYGLSQGQQQGLSQGLSYGLPQENIQYQQQYPQINSSSQQQQNIQSVQKPKKNKKQKPQQIVSQNTQIQNTQQGPNRYNSSGFVPLPVSISPNSSKYYDSSDDSEDSDDSDTVDGNIRKGNSGGYWAKFNKANGGRFGNQYRNENRDYQDSDNYNRNYNDREYYGGPQRYQRNYGGGLRKGFNGSNSRQYGGGKEGRQRLSRNGYYDQN